jgi:thiamine biosynthesis lipoprotein
LRLGATCGPSAGPATAGASASRTPRGDGLAATLRLDDGGVATSGDYRVYYDEDRTAHHIVTPGTGRSPTEDTSVTVVASDAEAADAHSTAAFVMDNDRASSFVDARDDLSALFLTRDGGRPAAGGLDDRSS